MKSKLLLLSLLALLGSIMAQAYDFTQSGLCYNITSSSERTVAVAGRTGNESSLVIPSEVTYNGVTYSVTSIVGNAFYGYGNITDVIMPEGIISIGDRAFADNPISDVKIPASVQSIGEHAFGGSWDDCYECEDYHWVYYPKKYTVDENNQNYSSYYGILYNKDRTKLIDVPYGYNQDIYFPSALQEIPSNAFSERGCLEGKNLYIYNLSNFCQINITGTPSSSSYGDFFSGSVFSKISKIYEYSDGSGFNQLYNETLYIPSDVTKIGRGTFYGCKQISKVVFPVNGVTEIGDYAFGATKLTEVTLPASIQSIGSKAFYDTWTEYVDTGETDYDGDPIYETVNHTMAMSSLIIPQNIQSIGSYAFYLTSGATVTSKSTSPTNISNYAFINASNCTLAVAQGLQNTYSQKTGWNAFGTISEDEDIIPYIDGEIFTATTPAGLEMTFKVLSAANKTVQVGDGSNIAIDQSYEGDLIIPSQINGLQVTSIGDKAFKECKYLHYVDIPENVSLGDGAFYNAKMGKIIVKTAITSGTFFCAEIGELIIESTVSYGGYQAFFNTKIGRLEIKPSDTALTYSSGRNSYAMFEGCNIGTAIIERNMYSAYYGSGSKVPLYCSQIDSLYFRNKTCSCKDATIGDLFLEGVTSISSYWKCSATRLHLSEGLTTIGTQAFNASFKNHIIFPASLTEIGDNAIYLDYAPSVTSLALTPPTITEISFGSGNSYNTPLYVPQGCREQYASATGWNKFTTIIELPEAGNIISFADEETKRWCLTYYDLNGDNEIDENEALLIKSLNFAESKISNFAEISYFKNVEDISFRGCTSLTSITIPNSVTSIGQWAFLDCSSLTSITIPNSVTSIGGGAFQDCSGLTSITIPNSVTSIDGYTFYGCSGLTSITIPNSVTRIDDHAFYGCSGLTSVKVDIETPLTIGSSTFSNRANATLYVPAGSKTAYKAANYWKEFGSIIEFIEGDVNSDGETDVVDVVDIARFVVGSPAETFVEILADINRDGNVNIGDAVALVNEIAGDQNFAKPMLAPSSTTAGEDVLTLEQTAEGLALALTNNRDYTAFQFDLYVPEGTDVTQMLLNVQRKQKHQLLYNKVNEGLWRVAALSTSNRSFEGNDGELLSITLDGISNEDVTLSNILFFDTEGNGYQFDDITLNGTTAIEIPLPTLPRGEGAVYTLDGRRISESSVLPKGIYIVNGKKVVVK